jgi:hypothetical protein
VECVQSYRRPVFRLTVVILGIDRPISTTTNDATVEIHFFIDIALSDVNDPFASFVAITAI